MGGNLRGKTLITKIITDGLSLCHLGDIGEFCTEDIVQEIGATDILFIPVGGNYTIDSEQAKMYVEKIKPAIVITMAIIISTPLMKLPISIRDTASYEGKTAKVKLGNPNTKIFLSITVRIIMLPIDIPFKYIMVDLDFSFTVFRNARKITVSPSGKENLVKLLFKTGIHPFSSIGKKLVGSDFGITIIRVIPMIKINKGIINLFTLAITSSPDFKI